MYQVLEWSFHWSVVDWDNTNENSSFFKVAHFSYLIYILLVSPLYNKKELWATPQTHNNKPNKKEIPMDYHKVES